MILQFIGFFVVLVVGGWLVWWGGREMWYYVNYRMATPLDADDAIEVTIFVVAFCAGCWSLYFAGTHAPFEITLKI